MVVKLEIMRPAKNRQKNYLSMKKLTRSYCLARMYVKHHISTRNVEVDYIFTHINHSLGLKEVKHIPIPTSVQEEIYTAKIFTSSIGGENNEGYGIYCVCADSKHFITDIQEDIRRIKAPASGF